MSLWKLIHPPLKLFQYRGANTRTTKPCKPILMLHGTLASHRSWEYMAGQFWDYGINPLYALDIPEIQSGEAITQTFSQLAQAIQFLLDEEYAEANSIVLIGHGIGGILAYRYWQAFEDEARVSYLFMLATPHDMTIFPLLQEQMVRNPHSSPVELKSTQSPPVDFSKIKALQGQSSTVLVNIMGKQIEPDFDAVVRGMDSPPPDDGMITQAVGMVFDGVVRGLNLPEAVNWTLPLKHPLGHRDMNKDPRVVKAILSCLRGEHFRIMLKLVAIRLLRDDGGGFSGPIAFEIDGNRMPPDSVFHGATNRLYIFDENVPPICTLSYPLGDMSGTIILHLKDLSDQRGRRRRMYSRLHIPLRETDRTTHTMQDSEGSDLLWRIICQLMPIALEDPAELPKRKPVPRGI